MYLLDGFKVGDEEIGVIVGHLVLQHRHQTLQTHPCVDALLRQRLQLRLRLSEDKQKDFSSGPLPITSSMCVKSLHLAEQ